MNEFVKPVVEYAELSPLLIVFAGAFLGVVVEAFVPRARRFTVQVVLVLVVLLVALGATLALAADWADRPRGAVFGTRAAMGAVAVDGPTLFLWGLLLVLALLGTLLFAERRLDGGLSAFAGQAAVAPADEAAQPPERARWEQSEVYPLFLFAVTGTLLLPAADDLVVMFVALEILSLPLYLLSATARRRRLLSQEASLKYFLMGAFASAFLLYGAALAYGYAGTTSYEGIAAAVERGAGDDLLLYSAIGLLLVGLLFKVGAAPFHAWTPDVYQGAPTPLVAWMSAATKIAAFGALTRLLYVAFGGAGDAWSPIVSLVAVVSMALGTVLALTQDDVRRMLAYSSVAHAGFVLAGVAATRPVQELAPGELSATTAVLFYLATYGIATLGAFAVVTLVRDASGEVSSLRRWAGLGRMSPWVAGIFGLFMLGLAGIPLTSGFVGKWAVFEVAGADGRWPVVVTAVLMSAVAAAFYVRVIGVMFFGRAEPAPGAAPLVATTPSAMAVAVVGVTGALTLLLGVVPDPLLDLAGRAGEWLG